MFADAFFATFRQEMLETITSQKPSHTIPDVSEWMRNDNKFIDCWFQQCGCLVFLRPLKVYHTFFMSNTGTTGRVPLWLVGVVAGTAALTLLAVFFYGSYTGLGSSLSGQKMSCIMEFALIFNFIEETKVAM